MNVIETELPGVLVVEPRVFEDSRGEFFELYHRARFHAAGIAVDFVQDNVSRSRMGVLRGLHYQRQNPQTKLIGVTVGAVLDVAVDVRPQSPTFGRYVAIELSAENRRMLLVPAGFAHGFLVTRGVAEVLYKCSAHYDAADEGGIAWDDPTIAIRWPIDQPILSPRDAALPRLAAAALPALA